MKTTMANYEKTMAASTETLNYNLDPNWVKSFLYIFKGTVSLISSDPPCKDDNA